MSRLVLIASLTVLMVPGLTKGDDSWTMTDLRLVGFYARGLPSPAEKGRRVATPGQLNFLLEHFQTGSRYVCAVGTDLSSSRVFRERCVRVRHGELPAPRVAELRR